MKEDLEFEGQWFLPNNPEHRLQGVLKVDKDEGIVLKLYGNFDNNSPIPNLNHEEALILGVTGKLAKITLKRCLLIKSEGARVNKNGESSVGNSYYSILYILENFHFSKVEDITFKNISAQIMYLDEWVGISGFIRQSPIDMIESEKNKKKTFSINYELPDNIIFPINENVTGSFNFNVTIPGTKIFDKKLELSQNVEIRFDSKKELLIEECIKLIVTFQNFLILALYKKTAPLKVKLLTEDSERKKIVITLYFNISYTYNEEDGISFRDMIFDYRSIKDEFPKLIQDWYLKYDQLEPSFNLIFHHFYNDESLNQNTFLNFAQAAETFHWMTMNHPNMDEKEYDLMKKNLLSLQLPEKYQTWLKGVFSFGNHLTLHQRLEELLDKINLKILDEFLGDKEELIKDIKYSRNYYTHYNPILKKKAKTGIELFYLSEKLKILLVCAFLIEIGLDNEYLNKSISHLKHRMFPHLINR